MKKLSLLFGLLLVLMLVASPAGASGTGIMINGSSLYTDVQPLVEGDQVYLPVRAVAEALGADVGWDVKTNTVTVTKNGKLISIDTNQNTVLIDGKEFASNDPVRSLDGRTMFLATILKEAFGADAALDATGKVSITYREQVAGMSPEELLVKSNEALNKYNTYKFKGAMSLESRTNDIPISTKMTMDGSYKKPGESYFKMSMPMPENKTLNMEGYIKSGKMYQNVNGEGWKEAALNVPADLAKQMNNNDPVKSLEMIKDIGGIISAGTPEKNNDKSYNVLKVTIDQVKYREFMKKIMAGLSTGTNQQADMQKAMEGIFSAMDINVSYKLFIDSNTNLMDRMDISEKIKMNMPGVTGTTTVSGSFNMYGFDLPVEMPQIPVTQTK